MIKVQNLSTGEIVNVLNVVVENGQIVSEARRPNKGKRFYESYPMVLPAGTSEDGRDMHTLAEGWSLATKGTKGTKKARKPKQETVINPQVEEVKEVVNEVTEQAKVENVTAEKVWQKLEQEGCPVKREVLGSAAEIASEFIEPDVIRRELAQKYGSMGADVFEAVMKIAGLVKPVVTQEATVNEEQVRSIVKEYFAGIKQEATVNEEQVRSIVKEYFAGIKQECRVIEVKSAAGIMKVGGVVSVIEVKSAAGIVKVEGVVNKNFDIFCNLVNAGKPLYMYGPAGSGKSYTAKQIAEALGLDYYETSQAIFAYELKGYGDAAGKFVETAFYKAFANGGVFFLDEVDASAPEALVVLNNAIANKRFDFPVVGNVNAHPNFRGVAAGNTRMTGATMEYVARQMQDTSFKNRFFFETVTGQ